VELSEEWERHAREWLAWTQPEHQDGFWTTTGPMLRSLLPPPEGVALDVGCGEGRGGRLLIEAGHRVVGVDTSPTLVRAARDGAPPEPVAIASAAALPVRSASVPLVLASMSLLDIEPLDAAIAEIARVLQPRGVLCAAILHPFLSALDPDELEDGSLSLRWRYLDHQPYADRYERDGLAMTFTSVHRPLSTYLGLLFAAGFVLTQLIEAGTGPFPWCLGLRAELQRPLASGAALEKNSSR